MDRRSNIYWLKESKHVWFVAVETLKHVVKKKEQALELTLAQKENLLHVDRPVGGEEGNTIECSTALNNY